MLAPWIECLDSLKHFQAFYFYAGADCFLPQCGQYLSVTPEQQRMRLVPRLQAALGISQEMVDQARTLTTNGCVARESICGKFDELLMSTAHGCATLQSLAVRHPDGREQHSHASAAALDAFLTESRLHRECDPDARVGQAAMKPKLRNFPRNEPVPMLTQCCQACDAEFPNKVHLRQHWQCTHGGAARFYEVVAALEQVAPHVVAPPESRKAIEDFAWKYRYGADRELLKPFKSLDLENQKLALWVDSCSVGNRPC